MMFCCRSAMDRFQRRFQQYSMVLKQPIKFLQLSLREAMEAPIRSESAAPDSTEGSEVLEACTGMDGPTALATGSTEAGLRRYVADLPRGFDGVYG